MPKLPYQPIPPNPRRIVLIHPTKYLGNLLLAGGLIQAFAALCRQQNREFVVVLDASFKELCSHGFADIEVFWYPRQAIRRAQPWQQVNQWLNFVWRLRRYQADLAFNIEEDSVTSRLTQFSGAAYRLGCSPARQRFGYHRVLPIEYGLQHRWFTYQAVFGTLGMPATTQPYYADLQINQPDEQLIHKLHKVGLRPEQPLVAIHPAATKAYKQWPESAFIKLCNILINKGYVPVLIGAGDTERQRCERLVQAVTARPAPLNICGQLSLAELASLFRLCRGIVGNDSGPSHLASAQQLPGVVIFGPSDPAIWKPLGVRSHVMRKVEVCDPGCTRRACLADYRCLHAVQPEAVYEVLEDEIRMGAGT